MSRRRLGRAAEMEVWSAWSNSYLSKDSSNYSEPVSGGMKQRVAIGPSVGLRSELLLMDEPFGALDAQTRGALQVQFEQIWQDRQTVLFITHSVREAVYLSDRVLVLAHIQAGCTRRYGSIFSARAPSCPTPSAWLNEMWPCARSGIWHERSECVYK